MTKNNFKEYNDAREYLRYIDINKLKIFLAYEILKQARKKKNPKVELTYLKEYLARNADLISKDYKPTSTNLSIKNLYFETKKLVEKHEPKPIKKENNIEKYKYSFLETNPQEGNDIRGYFPKGGLSPEEDEAKKALLKRKTDYYQTLKIKKIKVGIDSFDGYLGLCLEDGTVILDKFFENMKEGRIADDEAIYITDEENFEKITSLTKTECINQIKEGKIKAKHKYHRGSWEERVLK